MVDLKTLGYTVLQLHWNYGLRYVLIYLAEVLRSSLVRLGNYVCDVFRKILHFSDL